MPSAKPPGYGTRSVPATFNKPKPIMSTDVLTKSQNQPRPPRPQLRNDPPDSSQGRWWKLGLFAIVLVAAVASAAALISNTSSPQDLGPKLTHTITRGDLIVTITAQGLVESSDNVEIKNEVRGRSTVIWVIESGTEVEAGDELVRLDTQVIDDAVAERSKYAHWSRSAAERSEANVIRAKLAIPRYEEGTYPSQLMELEKDLAIAESNLRTRQNLLDHAITMFANGYASELEVEQKTFAVMQARLAVKAKVTEIDVLKDHTRKLDLETLNGDLKASEARHEANKERAKMDGIRRDIAKEELKHCVVRAETSGLVIHPSAARWKNAPEIEEGASVYMEQVMLLMPDLSKMQVKLGIREADIELIKPGMAARVTLPDKTLDGEVSTVASVAAPPGLTTGDVVLYDTTIELPPVPGLKPGMSALVEVIVDQYENVLTIAVAAVVETAEGDFCWVKTPEGPQRRSLELGDTNNVFTVVQAGLKEGDEVALNPYAFEGPQAEVLKASAKAKESKAKSSEPGTESKPSGASKKQESRPQAAKPKKADSKPKITGAKIIKKADKNDDGVLTIDEYAEKDRHTFGIADTNKDEKVDAGELDALLKRLQDAKSK